MKLTKKQACRKVAVQALRVPEDDRLTFLREQSEILATAWDKPADKLEIYIIALIAEVADSLLELDITEAPTKVYSKDACLLDSNGDYREHKGMTDGETRDFEKSRGGVLSNAEAEDKTYVVMSPYDDTQFGEFTTLHEAQVHAANMVRSCYIACYSKSYGLEFEDWTTAPDYGIDSRFNSYRRQPGTRPKRSEPKRTSHNAADETHQSPAPRKIADASLRVETLEAMLKKAILHRNWLLEKARQKKAS